MRSSGSSPTVGSSKIRKGGSPSSADAHPLPLAAGERAYLRFGLLLQADHADDLVDGGFGAAQALEGGHVVEELSHRQFVEKAEVLRQVAQLFFQHPLVFAKRLPVHQYGPARGLQRRHQQLHERGFARPVGAQKADEAGAFQREVQALERLFPAGVGHAELLNVDLHNAISFLFGMQKG